MEIVIDRHFFEGFKRNNPEEQQPAYDNFLIFMDNLHKDSVLIGNYSTLEEFIDHMRENPLLERLLETPMAFFPAPNLQDEICEPAFYERGCSLKLFFVEKPEAKCKDLERRFGYYYFSGKLLGKTWGGVFTDREIGRYFITSRKAIPDNIKFDSWRKLKALQHPLNAIVIVDKYILVDGENQSIEANLKPLLLEIIPNKQNELPIEIIIIAEQGVSNNAEHRRKGWYEKQEIDNLYFRSVFKELKRFLKENFPNTIIDLTIAVLDKKVKNALKNEGFEIHDRRIITNYYWIEAGKGFNLFDNSNQVKASDSKLYYGFNANGANIVDIEHLLECYAKCIEKCRDHNIYGSKNNRLLTHFKNRLVEQVKDAEKERITYL